MDKNGKLNKFPEKVFEKSEYSRNANHWTENAGNTGSKIKWNQTLGKPYEVVFFSAEIFWEMIFHPLAGISRSSKQIFLSNGKRSSDISDIAFEKENIYQICFPFWKVLIGQDCRRNLAEFDIQGI